MDEAKRATVADLLASRIDTDVVEIPGVGYVTVRGLSRWEMLTAGKLADKGGTLAVERAMLAFAMVEPALTEDEVSAWQKASPAAEIKPVVTMINRLSGVGRQEEKAAYLEFRDEPGD